MVRHLIYDDYQLCHELKSIKFVLCGGRRIGQQSNLEKLDWFAGELILEHRRRSCKICHTIALKQATPRPSWIIHTSKTHEACIQAFWGLIPFQIVEDVRKQ